MRSHFFFWFCFFEQEDIVDYNRSVTVFILIPPPPQIKQLLIANYKRPSCVQWCLVGGTVDVKSC